MRMLFAITSFIIVFALAACAEKVTSICGGTGACCATGYFDDKGQPNYTVFQCIPKNSCGTCGENTSGAKECPKLSPPEGQCGVKRKTTWIWEGDFWSNQQPGGSGTASTSAPLAPTPAIALVASAPMVEPSAATKALQTKALADDPAGFCKAGCDSGHPGWCPGGNVPNSVSWGLLSTIAELAEKGDTSDRTIPISTVEGYFGAPGKLLGCTRGDLVVKDGIVTNTGPVCDADLDPKVAGKNVDANLVTDMVVNADIATKPGFALFDQGKGFTLAFFDAALNKDHGGSLRSAVRAKGDILALSLEKPGDTQPRCAGVRAVVDDMSGIHEAIEVASKNPALVDRAVADVRQTLFAGEPPSTPPNSSLQPGLLPLTSAMEMGMLIAPQSAQDQMNTTVYGQSESGINISAKQLVTLVDMEICHQKLADKSLSELSAMIPEITGEGMGAMMSMMNAEKVAGDLVLCRFGYDALPEALRGQLKTVAASLGVN